MEKTTIEKLRILLPHWIGHSHQHAEEFKKWAELAQAEGHADLAGVLEQTVASMGATDALLAKAASLLGVSPTADHGHHGGGCGHDHHQSGAAGGEEHHHVHGSHDCCHAHHGEKK